MTASSKVFNDAKRNSTASIGQAIHENLTGKTENTTAPEKITNSRNLTLTSAADLMSKTSFCIGIGSNKRMDCLLSNKTTGKQSKRLNL